MANILEFLRGVLTDDDSRRIFRGDPEGYVVRSGFADLTGEDVVEAVSVLRRSLPPAVATALADFDDEARLPPVRPGIEERELDAALRQLHHAVDVTDEARAATAGTAPASGVAGAPLRPSREESSLFWSAAGPPPTSTPAAPEPAPTPATAPATLEEHAEHHEPIDVESELPPAEPAAAPAATASLEPGHPAMRALHGAIESAASELRSRLDEFARDVLDRLSAVVDDAERDADRARADAERDARELRAQAEADREEARRVLDDARTEAERVRNEAAEGRAELEARRSELKDAERELRERLAGLDDVFRTVLRDE